MFNMIKFGFQQNASSQLYIKIENERKNELNKEVVEVFSNAIKTGFMINHSIPSIDTDQATKCFNTALKPFIYGNKFLSQMMIFLLAKSCNSSTFNCIPDDVYKIIKMNLFQFQSQELKELTFGTFYSNQLSLEAKLSIQAGNVTDKLRGLLSKGYS